jgi:5-methyltetrahydrofolate--homocysteine methyltransferase
VSFHKCNSNSSDDILIYDENNVHIDTLHGLRQQAVKESADSVFYSISDFIAPVEKNKADYIGCFAVTILGVEDICKQFEKSFDDYK